MWTGTYDHKPAQPAQEGVVSLRTLLRGDDETAALCDVILAMLEAHPRDWEFCRFHAKHKSGLGIWIANQCYGLHIEHHKTRFNTTEIRPRWWIRRKLWRACRGHRAAAIKREMMENYCEIRDNVVAGKFGK